MGKKVMRCQSLRGGGGGGVFAEKINNIFFCNIILFAVSIGFLCVR